MKKAAFFDLTALLLVFWAAWSLRFFGVGQIGAISMAATGALGVLILIRRKIRLADIGLKPVRRRDFFRALEVVGVIGVVFVVIAPALIFLLGPLSPSAAITEQPQDLRGFVIDIVVFTWIAAALGEEFVFRGVILNRFEALFGAGTGGVFAAALMQAVWFGAGHASQGITGVALTSTLGFALAIYFLTRAERSLLPLIIAHAGVNTAVLTVAFFS